MTPRERWGLALAALAGMFWALRSEKKEDPQAKEQREKNLAKVLPMKLRPRFSAWKWLSCWTHDPARYPVGGGGYVCARCGVAMAEDALGSVAPDRESFRSGNRRGRA